MITIRTKRIVYADGRANPRPLPAPAMRSAAAVMRLLPLRLVVSSVAAGAATPAVPGSSAGGTCSILNPVNPYSSEMIGLARLKKQ